MNGTGDHAFERLCLAVQVLATRDAPLSDRLKEAYLVNLMVLRNEEFPWPELEKEFLTIELKFKTKIDVSSWSEDEMAETARRLVSLFAMVSVRGSKDFDVIRLGQTSGNSGCAFVFGRSLTGDADVGEGRFAIVRWPDICREIRIASRRHLVPLLSRLQLGADPASASRLKPRLSTSRYWEEQRCPAFISAPILADHPFAAQASSRR